MARTLSPRSPQRYRDATSSSSSSSSTTTSIQEFHSAVPGHAIPMQHASRLPRRKRVADTPNPKTYTPTITTPTRTNVGPATPQRAGLALKGQGYITVSAHHHHHSHATTTATPSSIVVPPPDTEERWDGDEKFTKHEFVDFYGGEEEWDEAEPVVAPMTTSSSSPSAASNSSTAGHPSLSQCRTSFSIETWIYISRTEALYSESSARVRKHNGIECDSGGNFVSWKCCGRDDPDPLSWCPVWQGDTRNILPQVGAVARVEAAGVATEPQGDDVPEHNYRARQNIGSAHMSPEAIYAMRRTRPCVVAAQEYSAPSRAASDSDDGGTAATAYAFFLHDAGAVAPDGTEYGFGIRWADNTTTVVTDYHVPVDRWVYFAATYDGCYMGVYIDGELVASKCRDTPTVDNQQSDVAECMISTAHPITVGGTARGGNNFVGCKFTNIVGRAA
jgi:hypothetical protein